MKGKRLYWLTFGWFGLLAMANGWIGLQGDAEVVPVATALAGGVLVIAAGNGLLRPEDTDVPNEPGLLLYVGLLAAGTYTVSTLFRIL